MKKSLLHPSHKKNIKALLETGLVFFRDDGEFSDEEFKTYGIDRTKIYTPRHDVIVFPKSTEEVSRLITYACKHQIPVFPSGGRTGYCGGAVAHKSGIVITLEKMDKLIEFFPEVPSAHVQAGMITKDLQDLASSQGLLFPVDLAASGSSHIGGNIATNAGGLYVIKYGATRNWVLGLTVVTGTGKVLKLNGNIIKNNTGLDLKNLIIGSEGILGIITEAILLFSPRPKNSGVVIFPLEKFNSIEVLLKRCYQEGIPILAFEFFDRTSLQFVKEHLELPNPFTSDKEYPYYLLLEYEMDYPAREQEMMTFLEKQMTDNLFDDCIISESERKKKELWKYREGISESLSMKYIVHKNDISLPIKYLNEFLKEMKKNLTEKDKDISLASFGHVGDGNIHINLVKPDIMDEKKFHQLCEEMDLITYSLVKSYQGSISGEHGIGLLKKSHLHFTRSSEEIRIMRAIKESFDPSGILNPGKVLP
jgi:FAD/FMN-containing dehydrogenase